MVNGYYTKKMNFERNFMHIPNTTFGFLDISKNKLGWLNGG